MRRDDLGTPAAAGTGSIFQWLTLGRSGHRSATGAIIGGVAASIPESPRLTEGIDVLVIPERQEWKS